MRAQIERARAALVAGRDGATVLAEIADAFALVGLAWFAISLFLAMEPLS